MTPAQEWQIRKDGGAPVGRKRRKITIEELDFVRRCTDRMTVEDHDLNPDHDESMCPICIMIKDGTKILTKDEEAMADAFARHICGGVE
jgi:hypothetical protein